MRRGQGVLFRVQKKKMTWTSFTRFSYLVVLWGWILVEWFLWYFMPTINGIVRLFIVNRYQLMAQCFMTLVSTTYLRTKLHTQPTNRLTADTHRHYHRL